MGKSRLGLNGAVPARIPAQATELIMGLVHDAVLGGAAHRCTCPTTGCTAGGSGCEDYIKLRPRPDVRILATPESDTRRTLP